MTTATTTPIHGRRFRPPRILIYGPQKVGKTTFAAGARDVILVGNEDGADDFDVSKMPAPSSWGELMEQVRWLIESDHKFRTVALDTLDWIEPLLIDHICSEARAVTLHDGQLSYGKGTARLLDEWRKFLRRLEQLRAKKEMAIVALAHAHVRKFENPSGPDHDRWELKCNEKTAGLFVEWVDVVGFLSSTTVTNKDGKAIDTGERLLYTTDSAAWVAGSRWGIPSPMTINQTTGWQDFMLSVVNAYKSKGEEKAA